jgi:hypothetical protein
MTRNVNMAAHVLASLAALPIILVGLFWLIISWKVSKDNWLLIYDSQNILSHSNGKNSVPTHLKLIFFSCT